VTPTAEFGNRTDILVADIPAGGKMSARAVARMYAALIDEVDGVRLISPERLREIIEGTFTGVDEIMGFPTTWALGYAVGGMGVDSQGTSSVLGVGGVGGSYACADTATGVTWALTKNRLTADFTAAEQVSGIVTKAIAES
jgi:CubicO group peptidase (beta-lactamase class C family)